MRPDLRGEGISTPTAERGEEERNNGTSNNLNTTNTAAGADGWVGEATNGGGGG